MRTCVSGIDADFQDVVIGRQQAILVNGRRYSPVGAHAPECGVQFIEVGR